MAKYDIQHSPAKDKLRQASDFHDDAYDLLELVFDQLQLRA